MIAVTVSPPKATHIAILLHSMDGGGAQRRMVTLANAFVASGRRVDFLLVRRRGELISELSPQIRQFSLGRQDRRLARREVVKDLADWLVKESPDALLSGAAAVHSFAVAAHDAAPEIPLILRASSHPLRPISWSKPRQRLKELLERRARARCYARADAIIAVSKDVAAAVQRLAPATPIKIIHNPVVTSRFLAGLAQPIDLPWGDELDIPMIISIGRAHPAKDFPTLLRAFALLRATRLARLVIIGDGFNGSSGEPIRKLIAGLGIRADVALLDPTNFVAAWLARSALFVSSSIWEGSPGVLVEAMALGCSVVATDCPGGSRELLQEGRIGRLVAIRNPAALAWAMAAELDDPTAPETLMAASESYREEGRAEEYLAVVDHCAEAVLARAKANGTRG